MDYRAYFFEFQLACTNSQIIPQDSIATVLHAPRGVGRLQSPGTNKVKIKRVEMIWLCSLLYCEFCTMVKLDNRYRFERRKFA